MTDSEQAGAQLWLATYSNPKQKLLSVALQKDNQLNRQIIRHGLQRLTRKDLTAAYATWYVMQKNYAFGSDLHDQVERYLALRAARGHDARATTWMYELSKDVIDASIGMWRIFRGKYGNFDSTKPDTIRIETDENIKTDVGTDLYTELRKLKELYDDGIITDDEYASLKKKAIQEN